MIGFTPAEVDLILCDAAEADPNGSNHPDDEVPVLAEQAVSRLGDLWRAGGHLVLCGDAREPTHFKKLMDDERADLVWTDPPYNVKIDRNVCGSGSVKHREFAVASGEMSKAEFTSFLAITLANIASCMRDGAIAYVCMDWRHMGELLEAGEQAFTELKNVVIWNKTNAGLGSFYRSKFEMVFVFKNGTAEHTNTFGLGASGRHRTNVWDYGGISSMSAHRAEDLAMHPTAKPVAMIVDALKDCSRRGEIVLDAFGGSGSLLIAAHKTGRRARLIEYDPLYCDTIIRRWEKLTGKKAVLAENGMAFEDVADERLANSATEAKDVE